MQCHFTWDLDFRHTSFPNLRQHLEDINPQETHPYLGCFHNLLGFINFQVNAHEDALRSFKTAAEAFRGGAADEGPCLLVTYGNLAWLYNHLRNGEECQRYLSKVGVIMETHPPPFQDELHPEVYAENAWTLMSVSVNNPLVGVYLQIATARRPDMVAWSSSYVVWLSRSSGNELEEELMEKLRSAKERDPENTYLAVHYLNQRAMRGEDIVEEARMLAGTIMESPVGMYSGMKALLWIFTKYISAYEAMNLAEQLLERYPDLHYAKKCAAQCYRWNLENVRDRAIALHQDLILHYPDISASTKLHLANIYAPSDQRRAEQEYRALLEDPNPVFKQKIYYSYACFLFYQKHEGDRSAFNHMEVLKIPKQSKFYKKSYNILDRHRKNKRFPELKLEHFLSTVPPPEN